MSEARINILFGNPLKMGSKKRFGYCPEAAWKLSWGFSWRARREKPGETLRAVEGPEKKQLRKWRAVMQFWTLSVDFRFLFQWTSVHKKSIFAGLRKSRPAMQIQMSESNFFMQKTKPRDHKQMYLFRHPKISHCYAVSQAKNTFSRTRQGPQNSRNVPFFWVPPNRALLCRLAIKTLICSKT